MDMRPAFKRYINDIRRPPREKVWYDILTKTCFGSEQIWSTSNSRESFLTLKETFLSDPTWGMPYVQDYFGSFTGFKFVTSNLIASHPEVLDKIAGSKVLIVGGGPTANEVDWKAEDYDHILTCNHFFMNQKLSVIPNILLAFVGNEIDTQSQAFRTYFENSDTMVCFENVSIPKEIFPGLINHFGTDKVMFAHTRYRSKIGTAARLMIFAAELKAKEIHVVGMDGVAKGTKHGDIAQHSFQPGKHVQGAYDYDLYRRHYVVLWDQLLNELNPDILYKNLGEGHELNMSTSITSKELT